MNKLKKLRSNPWLLLSFVLKKIAPIVPDKVQLSLLHKVYAGKLVNWKDPKTFSEKLQWLKIHNKRPEYTDMVDKYAAKQYVAKRIGQEHIIPTLGVWGHPEDIDWDSLPNQFVLKTTHGGGGGGVFICKNKTSFDRKYCIKALKKALLSDLYIVFREYPYKDVPRRIIAEQFIESNQSDLIDYKIYCFGGNPKYIQVIQNRSTKETIDFFDTNWKHQEFFGLNPIARPAGLETMLKSAEVLSKDTPFLRVDFYQTETNVLFGEMTFFPASGFGVFTPPEWNRLLGDMLQLPIA